jgi:hypothetical protein
MARKYVALSVGVGGQCLPDSVIFRSCLTAPGRSRLFRFPVLEVFLCTHAFPHRKFASRFSNFLFDRAQLTRRGIMQEFTEVMWRRNRGHWSVEICNTDQYLEFARSLLVVDGLNAIVSATRFTIRINTGRCFDGCEVATAVARIVHEHFFPNEELAVSSGPGWRQRVLVPADSTRAGPADRDTECGSFSRHGAR